jgi:predicted nucleotidyltransferase
MPTPYEPHADPVVQFLIVEARADPDVLGLVLLGSRSVGDIDAESDYDVTFVVTDEAMERYQRSGHLPPRGLTIEPPIDTTDIGTTALGELCLDQIVAWMLPAWADARVLYDRTGETTRGVDALRFMPLDRAQDEIARWYDTYLNAFYRSLKAWKRGNAFGGHLEAAESVCIPCLPWNVAGARTVAGSSCISTIWRARDGSVTSCG